MRRKNEILAQLIGNEITLEEAMNRAIHIAIKLGDSEFQKWVNKEICGYNTNERVPDYRMMHGIITISDKYGNTNDLQQRINDEKFQIISHQGNALGIKGIQKTIDDSNFFIEVEIPAENYPYLQQFASFKIDNAKLKVNKTQFEDLLSSVRTELINHLSQKTKEVKNLNKYDMEKKMKKDVKKITINDHSINVGDGNTITGSNIGNNNQVIPKEDKKFFEKHPLITGLIASLLVAVFLVTKYGKEILSFFEGN